ncbi:hypothetical protein MKW94_017490 [Papaver nudicaule]|uniref:Cyanobacterial aminoacyl-tRNA synthetase CAAD domain-containing protein n=1 Tax=Papaver nudicaule TaxID=74823 RepID=A0AA41VXB5_PAPNU|nr:hypothetical protein [Papaver nudicaule]
MATMYAAAGASSMLVARPRLPKSSINCSLPYLPPRPSVSSFSTSIKNYPESSSRFSSLRVKAEETSSGSVEVNELFEDLKEKWDGLENKSTVLIYGGGGLVAVWLSTVVVGAINSVPLLPKIMELVGLGYTGWFVYRYLLFKSSRKELASDIESLKKKIAGTE